MAKDISKQHRRELRAEYDRLAPIYQLYFGKVASDRMSPVLIPLLQGFVPPPARVLDLCCGCGHVSAALSASGYSVAGIDISDEMLRYARLNAPAATFMTRDALHYQLSNDATVCTFNSIAHFSATELTEIFATCASSKLNAAQFSLQKALSADRTDSAWDCRRLATTCEKRPEHSTDETPDVGSLPG